MLWKLVSRPHPPAGATAEAEERAGGRAVACMWVLLHDFVGLQWPSKGVHGWIALWAAHLLLDDDEHLAG